VVELTKPAVFIIESLTRENEEDKIAEGYIISQILHLSGIESKYYYVRTKRELEEFIQEFGESDFRYLHLSCHGNKAAISTTFEPVLFFDLKKMLKQQIVNKRLFLSACYASNDELARKLIPISECLSIIGFGKVIGFDEAAIIWASFYYLVFKAMANSNSEKMERAEIISTLDNISNTLSVPINYFSISKSSASGYKCDKFPRRKKIIISSSISKKPKKP
jgi:hypothetical protein